MASFIMKKVGKKILGETLENKWGAKDPVFEQVPATRLDGTPNGKFKKVRRALPPGISEHDAEILTKVKRRAYKLDLSLFSFMGVRFGWSSVIGIFPIAGDFADFFLALMVINTAKKVDGGLPSSVTLKMYFWAIIDLIFGFVPFIGDVVDAMIKANARNAVSLEEHLRAKGIKKLRDSGAPIPEIDPSDPDVFDGFQAEESRGSKVGQTTRQANARPQSSGVTEAPPMPPRPAEARVHDNPRSGGGSFFGFGGSKKSRPVDPEMGVADDVPARKSSRRN